VTKRFNLAVTAPNIIEKPVFILTEDIARLEPALFRIPARLEDFFGQLLITPVALHHRWTPDDKLAWFSSWNGAATAINDSNFEIRHRNTDRIRMLIY